jgi:hypothetical protein
METEKDKIKQLLLSPDESNQRVGVQLAKSILDWDYNDIVNFVINENLSDGKQHIVKTFCGVSMYFSVSKSPSHCKVNCMGLWSNIIKHKDFTVHVFNKYKNKLRKEIAKRLKEVI